MFGFRRFENGVIKLGISEDLIIITDKGTLYMFLDKRKKSF